MLKTPNNLNDKQKQQYQEAWLNTLKIFVSGAKVIVFLIVLSLIYIPFENDFKKLFKEEPLTHKTNSKVSEDPDEPDQIENGIHLATGFIVAPGFEEVRANCTVCHSAKLVTQNRASRAGWDQMILWMQEKQGLWDLGDKKPVILDYLSTHYAPIQKGRRDNIKIADIEWYILDLEKN